MIIGMGTDSVKIAPTERAISRSAHALLAAVELQQYRSAAKACGTGIGKISWQVFEISNGPSGAPRMPCSGNARILLDPLGGQSIPLSMPDEEDCALALVVISGP